MKNLTRVQALVLVASLLACNSDDPTNPLDLGPTNEEIVLANVALVRSAADAFAAANEGAYPADLDTETTPGGETFIDFLPEGMRLLNPYSGELSEPQEGLATNPGGVGYEQVTLFGAPSSFLINGRGAEEEIALVDNIAELEAATIANAEFVVAAAEAFAADNNGLYASNIGSQLNLLGKDLIDYLPDGRLLMNSFTLANTEPVNGAAATSGQVGYVVSIYSGYGLGYVVNASGLEYGDIYSHAVEEDDSLHTLVKVNCYKTLDAAEQFAADNGGVYPLDTSSDTTPLGDTLVDLLGGVLLENPYTLANTEPQNVAAALSGETGYLCVLAGERPVGYRITGYGGDGVIFTLLKE